MEAGGGEKYLKISLERESKGKGLNAHLRSIGILSLGADPFAITVSLPAHIARSEASPLPAGPSCIRGSREGLGVAGGKCLPGVSGCIVQQESNGKRNSLWCAGAEKLFHLFGQLGFWEGDQFLTVS